MKLAALFSGGKDSTLAIILAKKYRHTISCLISLQSENPDSFMFHTPSISQVEKQAERMNIPIIIQSTKGSKERELKDLEKAILKAKKQCKIKGILTGAVESVYQSSRIQRICNKHKLEVFNPLWQKDQIELLQELQKNKIQAIITGVAALPLDASWLGRVIDISFIKDARLLQETYKISPAGEGGEFESLVLDCPLFSKPLIVMDKKITGEGNAYRMDVILQ